MLVLASQSQTRKTLLRGAGLDFAATPANIDERAVENAGLAAGSDPGRLAVTLAMAKARAVAQQHPEATVIGCDQTLALGDGLLHKPASLAEAAAQLDRLRGRTHRLHAGVALAVKGNIVWSHVDSAELELRDFSPAERDDVLRLEGDAVLQSVGGYRLEGPSIRLFESVRGDYFTILGLPLLPLLAALRRYAPDVFLRRIA